MKAGRPTLYTAERAAKALRAIRAGHPICVGARRAATSSSTLRNWGRIHPEFRVRLDAAIAAGLKKRKPRRNAFAASLKEDQVRQIRQGIERGLSVRDLAAVFGVKKSAVGDIRTRTTWRHLPWVWTKLPKLRGPYDKAAGNK